MSNSLKERIVRTVVEMLTFGILMGINFYVFCRENWLLDAILFAVSWGAGMFIADSIANIKGRRVRNIIFNGIIIVAVIAVGLFLKYMTPFGENAINKVLVPLGCGILMNTMINMIRIRED